jgi:hypothetical protein
MRLLLRRVLPEDQRRRAETIAGPLMPALGAAFALLSALTLTAAAGQLHEAEDQVGAEATAASRLAWGATSPGLDPAPSHAALLAYLEATRRQEWTTGGRQGGALSLAALADLERVVRAAAASPGIGSAQSGDLLAALGAVSSGRRQRLASAHHELPGLYMLVVVLSGLALIANSSALALDAGRRAALLPAGLVVVVALALALLYAISEPFHGGFVVSGYPMDQVISDLRAGVFRS